MKSPDKIRSHYLSVIVPIYNEEENIPLLHERLHTVLTQQRFSYEIIYIDDGSTDNSFAQLCRLLDKDTHVRVVQFRRNFGQTAAMAAGVAQSQGKILIFMDGDLQNDPVDIPRLLAKIDEGYDVVSGWRKDRQDAQWSRKFPSRIANQLISKVTGVYLHDYGCTLKAYRYEVFRHIRLYGEMHRFIPAYAALAGASITELPVQHHARQFGKSKYGISRVIRVLYDLTTLKFLGSYTTKPLYAFGTVGIAAIGLSIATAAIDIGRHIIPERKGRQRTSLLPETSLFAGVGLLSIMLGLIAEILSRTYYEAQDKHIYTLKQVLPEQDRPGLPPTQTTEPTAPTAPTAQPRETTYTH